MRSDAGKGPGDAGVRIGGAVVLQPLEYLFDRDPFRTSFHRPGPVVRAYSALTGRIQTRSGLILAFALVNAVLWLIGVLAAWGGWSWIRGRRRMGQAGAIEGTACG